LSRVQFLPGRSRACLLQRARGLLSRIRCCRSHYRRSARQRRQPSRDRFGTSIQAGVLGHWHSHGWPRRGGELTWLTETHAAPAGTQEQPYGQSQRAAETSSTLLMIRQAGNLASAHLGMLAHWRRPCLATRRPACAGRAVMPLCGHRIGDVTATDILYGG
jgi:hypothetical protein